MEKTILGCLQCWWHFFLLLRSVKGCRESWVMNQSWSKLWRWNGAGPSRVPPCSVECAMMLMTLQDLLFPSAATFMKPHVSVSGMSRPWDESLPSLPRKQISWFPMWTFQNFSASLTLQGRAPSLSPLLVSQAGHRLPQLVMAKWCQMWSTLLVNDAALSICNLYLYLQCDVDLEWHIVSTWRIWNNHPRSSQYELFQFGLAAATAQESVKVCLGW